MQRCIKEAIGAHAEIKKKDKELALLKRCFEIKEKINATRLI